MKFVLYLVFEQDLLADLDELSLNFQNDQLSLCSMRMKVMTAQTVLEKQKEKPGPLLMAFHNTDLFRYKGVEIKNTNVSAEAFERQKRGIVDYIITCIGRRFSTFNRSSPSHC